MEEEAEEEYKVKLEEYKVKLKDWKKKRVLIEIEFFLIYWVDVILHAIHFRIFYKSVSVESQVDMKLYVFWT